EAALGRILGRVVLEGEGRKDDRQEGKRERQRSAHHTTPPRPERSYPLAGRGTSSLRALARADRGALRGRRRGFDPLDHLVEPLREAGAVAVELAQEGVAHVGFEQLPLSRLEGLVG